MYKIALFVGISWTGCFKSGGAQGGGSPGVMGVGSLREAGGEGAGGGISKGGGNREKWEKFRNIGTTFHNRKSTQGAGSATEGGRNRECRVREAGSSDPPVPPPT